MKRNRLPRKMKKALKKAFLSIQGINGVALLRNSIIISLNSPGGQI
jgi:hypothetical protein